MVKDRIYAFIYGAEGVGKTSLVMTLSKMEGGLDVAFITAEPSGPTSVISLGYSPDIPCVILPEGEEPFDPAIEALEMFAADKSVRAICLDGITVMCGLAVTVLSDGAGEKALGWEGWGQVLNGFRRVEMAAEKAVRAGKSVVLTAWENPPTYEPAAFGDPQLKEEGRPMLQGKAKFWVPGKCDIVGRMTSTFKTVNVGGKAEKKFAGTLQVRRGNDYLAKTRWKLPDPCPADLQKILDLVQGQVGSIKSASPSVVKKKVMAK